ncbi:MAG: ADP-ribosylglycohydrolase family protein [Clostridia bacterium]|nr:ADP-ribosylglycohydrolase family protein [Clostridia bacterium]
MELKQKLTQLCAEYGLSRSQLAQMLDDSPKRACFNDRMGEQFSRDLQVEYRQCLEEGLDVRSYEALFDAVDKMPVGDHRDAIAEVLYQITRSVPRMADYAYVEPSDYEGIRACAASDLPALTAPSDEALRTKVAGAWYGRIVGCLLGKPVEGVRRHTLIPFLTDTENYPMHRYIVSTDITPEISQKYDIHPHNRCWADRVSAAPIDDDTNYTVLYQQLIEQNSRNFTPEDVAHIWVARQPKTAYFTAESVAYCNFIKGYLPPDSAQFQNHYREWIGAQIRADYFGYINPADPVAAAEMAWRDASVSHVKNGIYGEMFVAAMLAAAAASDDIFEVIAHGLAQIPVQSRLHARVSEMVADYKNGVSEEEAIAKILAVHDDRTSHDWCHTISNARIVIAALLYGQGDFSRSICLAVQTGFDTDCNGATVGSILGMMHGLETIGKEWLAPLHGKQETSIFGVGTVEIADLIEKTMEHIAKR